MDISLKPVKYFGVNRVLPAVYTDEISYYEVLAKLTEKINEVIETLNQINDIYATIEMLEQSQAEQDARIAAEMKAQYDYLMTYIQSEVIRLEELIRQIVAGQVTVFDPTYGIKPRPVGEVISNTYHWTRYYADYAGEIDALAYTASQRDGFGIAAKTFDLFSMQYYTKAEAPHPYTAN